MFFKTDILKNFEIYTRKHLCWSLFLACNFIKKRFQRGCFPVIIAKFLRAVFIYRTPLVVASVSWNHDVRMFDILNENDSMHQFSC